MYSIKKIVLSIPLICILFNALGQDTKRKIEQEILALSGPNTEVGFQLLNLNTNEILYGWNDSVNLVPASIQKCITAFSVLHFLGEGYEYKTTISYTGEILRDGNLTGNIVIVGSGDPSTGSSKHFKITDQIQFFDAISAQISKAGIKCIDGDIIIDVSAFGRDNVPRYWLWEDLGNYYGAGVWGVNYNENTYAVFLNRKDIIGAAVSVDHIEPAIPGLVHYSSIVTAETGTGDQAYIFGGPYSYERTIEGTIPRGNTLFKIRGSMPDPPKYFGEQLGDAISRRNIAFRSIQIKYNPGTYKNIKKINSLQSPQLEELVERMLEDSHNMYAEAFVKKIGDGSYGAGIDKIHRYILESGIDFENGRIADGSGLSVLNRISPDQMNSFMRTQCKTFGLKKIKKWMPLAGEEGTVSNMFKNSPAQGHVWIKSGSMDGVLCYHGIINTSFRQNYAFTIMINGDITSRTIAKQRIESLLNLIYQNPL